MRLSIMLGVAVLMLFTVASPSGAFGATMDDVKSEMAKNPSPWWGTQHLMYVPMAGSSNTLVSMANLCVSGGRLRPLDGANVDVGSAPQDNQYLVNIVMRDGGGYDVYRYQRKVSLPDCK
jgi:hypothetical protein